MKKKIGAVAVLAACMVLGLAAPAFAHVTLDPDSAPKGGFTKLTFRVPNEEPSADTTSFAVQFPSDHPLTSVSVKPKDGWTIDVQKAPLSTPLTDDDGNTITEAVSTITWSGGKVAPGQFDEFDVSVGPLPKDADSLRFPAVQTYSDGTKVSWIEDSVEGQPEPAHPAPVLTLTAANSSSSSSSSQVAAPAVSSTSSTSDADTARTLAIVGIALGAVGVVLGLRTYAMVRRSR